MDDLSSLSEDQMLSLITNRRTNRKAVDYYVSLFNHTDDYELVINELLGLHHLLKKNRPEKVGRIHETDEGTRRKQRKARDRYADNLYTLRRTIDTICLKIGHILLETGGNQKAYIRYLNTLMPKSMFSTVIIDIGDCDDFYKNHFFSTPGSTSPTSVLIHVYFNKGRERMLEIVDCYLRGKYTCVKLLEEVYDSEKIKKYLSS